MQGRKQVAFSGGHDKMEGNGLRGKMQPEVFASGKKSSARMKCEYGSNIGIAAPYGKKNVRR